MFAMDFVYQGEKTSVVVDSAELMQPGSAKVEIKQDGATAMIGATVCEVCRKQALAFAWYGAGD